MSRLSLDSVKWKEFVLGNLFDIQIGKAINGNKIQGNLGEKPYITRKVTDNGLDNFIDNYPREFLYSDVPVITIGNETAKPFVQVTPFYTGTKVNILKPKEQLEKEKLLFVGMALEKACDRYSYSFTANSTRLKKQIILLPVDANGNPNWRFMGEYVKQKQNIQTEKLINYYEKKLLGHDVTTKLPCVNWKSFWLEDIVDIKSGKDIYHRERLEGDIPYITATAGNNGIGYFIGNTNATLEEDCISVNRNGSVGYSFYHPYKALYGNDTRKLMPKVKGKYVSLFITTSITKQREKYGYGYKMGTGRLKRQKIMLPVDENGNPHWEYMHKYMQKIESEKIGQLINYYNNKELE
jgi:spore coat polysaccharide biosynthesis protein SpsF (cytidylyltransferase family)